MRHDKTNSHYEVLLNVQAHELQPTTKGFRLDVPTNKASLSGEHQRSRGPFPEEAMIARKGIHTYRD